LQTCQAKSAATQVHDWVVYRLGGILGSVVHRVKIHNITPVTGKERVTWKTGLRRLAKTPRLDRLPSSSAYTHIRFYFDAYAFWKITSGVGCQSGVGVQKIADTRPKKKFKI
jgi:hypothetical protein